MTGNAALVTLYKQTAGYRNSYARNCKFSWRHTHKKNVSFFFTACKKKETRKIKHF